MAEYGYYDDHSLENWDDPLATDAPCPWGGLGNYVLLDHNCDWRCPYREACMKIKERAQQERQGRIWRRLFRIDETRHQHENSSAGGNT